MTTRELIAKLSEADPSGDLEVLLEQPDGNYSMYESVHRLVDEDGEEDPDGEPIVLLSSINA